MHIAIIAPFIPLIATFVTGFSSSHVSDFQSLPNSSCTPPLCVHTSHWISANLGIETGPIGGGAVAPLLSHGDANVNHYHHHQHGHMVDIRLRGI